MLHKDKELGITRVEAPAHEAQGKQ
jgi:hypothetical protein